MSRVLTAVAIAMVSWGVQVQAQCQQIAGNYYCDSTDAVSFNNVGFSGTYNAITAMDSTSCTCASVPKSFAGGLAPLNEELSLHFRGPVQISQIAVYHRGSSAKVKREAEAEPDHHHAQFPALHRHKRNHVHHRRGHTAKVVTVTETVYSTSTRRRIQSSTSDSSSCTTTSASTTTSNAVPSSTQTTYAWVRDTYYNAATGEADNIVFTNYLGGTNGSGAWDSCFGNTLSYANCDGVTAAAAPQTLANVLIPSNKEVIIFSGAQCGASDCGFVRPGTPAYHGFSTSGDTIFLLEFEMPRDSSSGFNVDMSAVWFLNAQIPRTLQYGNAQCSCWTTGCGEFDAFEILSTGSNFLTTTIHSWQGTGTQYGGGGCSDYFNRPLSSTMKAAVIFSSSTETIKSIVLDPSVDFSAGLTEAIVDSWSAVTGSVVNIAG